MFLGMIVILKRRSVYFPGLSVGGKQLGCTAWLLRMFITISSGKEVHGYFTLFSSGGRGSWVHISRHIQKILGECFG